MREAALLERLNITPKDVLVIKDEGVKELFFTDDSSSDADLVAPQNTTVVDASTRRAVSLHRLAQLEQKVVLVGSLYGFRRLRFLSSPQHDYDFFAARMIFQHPLVLEAAGEIVERLGGDDSYVAVHARVTERHFARQANASMQAAWEELVRALGITDSVRVRITSGLVDSSLGGTVTFPNERHNSSLPQRLCRHELHDDPDLVPFNTPLYLATDSPSTLDEPSLRRFYSTFPCVVTLDDLEHANDSLTAVARLRK